jgi:chromosomal replication initiator protein
MAYLTPEDIDACKAILAQNRGHIARIVDEVAESTGISSSEIYARSRRPSIVRARQLVMFVARNKTDLSLAQIGRALGGLDQSTVRHGIGAEAARRGLQ